MHTGKILPFAVLAATCFTTTILVASERTGSVVPHGVIDDSGWALARLNDGASPSSGSLKFHYPESSRAVRLYLIDSAVDNTSGWFDGNSNLTFGDCVRVQSGSSYDPHTETASLDHGSRILSVIAGAELGAACGVPVEVHSFDIYTGGTPVMSDLVSAIGQATTKHQVDKLSDPDLLGVICIANGTGAPTSSPALLSAINQALGHDLVVVVSAGNDSADALNGHTPAEVMNHTEDAYLPAAYGSSLNGLISVGASNQGNGMASVSNFGSAIDFWAPGVDVLTFNPASPGSGQTSPMLGTSPAAALVAAAAIGELSRQPDLDPAGIESELSGRLYGGTVSIVQIDDDLDGDGSVDELERFFGYPIDDAGSAPPSPGFAVTESTSELSFTINADLWQSEDPMNLADGSAWRLLASTDMANWYVVDSFLSVGSEADGRIPVTVIGQSGSAEASGSSGAPKSWVATETQVALEGEMVVELFETAHGTFPVWYWQLKGIETHDAAPASATVSPEPRNIFYRIEVIPNP